MQAEDEPKEDSQTQKMMEFTCPKCGIVISVVLTRKMVN